MGTVADIDTIIMVRHYFCHHGLLQSSFYDHYDHHAYSYCEYSNPDLLMMGVDPCLAHLWQELDGLRQRTQALEAASGF